MSTDGRGWVYEIRVHSRLSVVQNAFGHEGGHLGDTRFRGIYSVESGNPLIGNRG